MKSLYLCLIAFKVVQGQLHGDRNGGDDNTSVIFVFIYF